MRSLKENGWKDRDDIRAGTKTSNNRERAFIM